MKNTFILMFVLFCTSSFAQNFEIMSEASQIKNGKKNKFYSVYVQGFTKSDEHYQRIVSYGDSLKTNSSDFVVQALFFTEKKFFFDSYTESLKKFKDKVINEYSYYNRICVALYGKGKILTKSPVKTVNDKRFK